MLEHLSSFGDDMIANGNNVSVKDILSAIETLHECQVCDGHPYIELHSDGSLAVMHPRYTKILERFHNLEEFIECMKIVAENREDEV